MSQGETTARRRRWPHVLGWLAFGALASASIVAACARWHWGAEIVASFRWQLGQYGLVVPIALGILRRPLRALVALALCLWCVWPELVLYVPSEPPTGDGPELELLVANVLFTNRQVSDVEEWIRAEDSDVLLLTEVSEHWEPMLDRLSDRWPFRDIWPRTPAGLAQVETVHAVLSRTPVAPTVNMALASEYEGTQEVLVAIAGREVHLYHAHLPRAGAQRIMSKRNRALDALGGIEWEVTDVLVGDLNTSGTSPYFADILRRTGLGDSRRGFGRQATWAPPFPASWLSVALDHVLVGDGYDVIDRRDVEIPGSDHRGVVVRLRLARAD